MKFNLANTSGSATSRLKPWGIYAVEFKGIENKTGTTKDGRTWKAFQLKFEAPEGTYEQMFFCPGEGGDKRRTGETGGRKWELPSEMENFAGNIAHFVSVMNPEGFTKIQGKLNLDLPREFDKLVEVLVAALKSAIGRTFYLKLVGNNRGYADIPSLIRISKEGNAFPANNWLSSTEGRLAFSPYEMREKDKAAATTPTQMPDVEVPEEENKDDDLDLDLTDL